MHRYCGQPVWHICISIFVPQEHLHHCRGNSGLTQMLQNTRAVRAANATASMTATVTDPAAPSWAPIWQRVQTRLQDFVSATNYSRWLAPMTVKECDCSSVTFVLPSKFLRDWVETHYRDRLFDLWRQESGRGCMLTFIVENVLTRPKAMEAAPVIELQPQQQQPQPQQQAPAGFVPDASLSTPLDPRFTFESFVVGKPNELAFAAAQRIASAPTPNLNPLFLYGGVGLGKTHLMHAIAAQVKKTGDNTGQPRRVIYMSAEKFMSQFINSMRQKNFSNIAFKEQFRNVDMLMIDDVQFLIGKENTQEEFFHTFNALIDQNKQIVLSADKSPTDLEGLQDRLRSRLGWGLCADIHPTTYELRLGILQAKLEQMGSAVIVPPAVLEFLAHKIASNVRELEGALTRVVAHAELVGRPVTLESAQDQLSDLLRAYDRRVTIDDIQKRVAEHFNIKLGDMTSPRRQRVIARPRQVAMYLAKTLTVRSLPEIGRKFGGRDHTTVLHAVRTIDKLMASDQVLAEDVQLLERLLKN